MIRKGLLCVAIWMGVVASAMPVGAESDVSVSANSGGEACGSYRIDVILIEGLLRTRREVVERELVFQEGDFATIEDVDRSIRRLRNTGLFQSVSYEILEPRVGQVGEAEESIVPGRLLRLQLDERWTLSPSFGLSSGGETFQLRVGAKDANLFGTFRQLGGLYTRLGDTNSFSLWYRDPRFFDRRLRLTVDGTLGNRLLSYYTSEGVLEGGYLLTRWRLLLGLQQEWRSWFRTAAFVSGFTDSFSYDLVNEARQATQEERGGLPNSVNTLQVGLSAGLGRMDEHGYRYRGNRLTVRVDEYVQGDGGGRGSKLTATAEHFSEWPLRSNFAVRGKVGLSWVDRENQYYFAGGLDSIRGTVDNRFHGRHYWLANVEYRIPSLELPWVVMQHVIFLDALGIGDAPGELRGLEAATTGIGIRLISPDIYGLLLRVDYTLPVMGADGPALSFGAGQFF